MFTLHSDTILLKISDNSERFSLPAAGGFKAILSFSAEFLFETLVLGGVHISNCSDPKVIIQIHDKNCHNQE